MIPDRYDLLTATTSLPLDNAGISDFTSAVFDAVTGPHTGKHQWRAVTYLCLLSAVQHEALVHPGATLGDLADTLNSRSLPELRAIWSTSPSRAVYMHVLQGRANDQLDRDADDIEAELRLATSPYLASFASLTRHHPVMPTRLFHFSFEATYTDELTVAIETGVGMMIGECSPVGRAYVGVGLHPDKIITVLERVTETGWRLWGGTVKPLADTDWDGVAALHMRARTTVASISSEWTETNLYAHWISQTRDSGPPVP